MEFSHIFKGTHKLLTRAGRSGFDPQQGQRIFLLASASHPASYSMGTGGPFPGGKARPGRDADHSPPSSAEVKNEQGLRGV
jgi:hypothetical protein